MRNLFSGLEDSNCKLEILRLYDCGITAEGCAALASALRSNLSHLRQLDLTDNTLGDLGIRFLSDRLKYPHCKLETLKMRHCGLTEEGCASLASALRSNPTHLKELTLSINELRDRGVTTLCAALKDPRCKLEILK